ncbi:hypothetical protein IWX90DRAFT_152512 [Phyllosticta citrichinensis]|uniref:Secreted protein n=1 Tax=Phyllosticta citrichinensis TaxID=1130410 RepID=A0ABR1XZH0_9PEZI
MAFGLSPCALLWLAWHSFASRYESRARSTSMSFLASPFSHCLNRADFRLPLVSCCFCSTLKTRMQTLVCFPR